LSSETGEGDACRTARKIKRPRVLRFIERYTFWIFVVVALEFEDIIANVRRMFGSASRERRVVTE